MRSQVVAALLCCLSWPLGCTPRGVFTGPPAGDAGGDDQPAPLDGADLPDVTPLPDVPEGKDRVAPPSDLPTPEDRVVPVEDRVVPVEDRVTPPVDMPVVAACGDGVCGGAESCVSCAADCGSCPARCGDGTCNASETCMSCAADCGPCPPSCGNGTCDSGETCTSCPRDCGSCPARCGDGMCNGAETCTSCAADCGPCPARCGDGMCNGTETCSTCSTDCGACAPRCGDGTCNGAETCSTCSADCGACTSPVTTACPSATDNTMITRDCGWTRANSYTCTPGASVLAACSAGSTGTTDAGIGCATRLGSCTGDTMMRICSGDSACASTAAIASNDDYCGLCSGVSFTCPPSGRYTVLVGPYHSNGAASSWSCTVGVR